jgi:hypothetical protein
MGNTRFMKAPRYFCENCGVEVKRNAKICPECGRFFASVRCPKCGFTGQPDNFISGCPRCGYSDPANAPGKGGQDSGKKVVRAESENQALPWWTYLAAFLGLCGVLILLALSFR